MQGDMDFENEFTIPGLLALIWPLMLPFALIFGMHYLARKSIGSIREEDARRKQIEREDHIRRLERDNDL